MRSHLTHTSEVLASVAMKRLFARLQERYDYVIVDLSPLAPVADVRAATHLINSYLFVVEWGKTKIDVVERALNTARGVYNNLLGVILNKVDFVGWVNTTIAPITPVTATTRSSGCSKAKNARAISQYGKFLSNASCDPGCSVGAAVEIH